MHYEFHINKLYDKLEEIKVKIDDITERMVTKPIVKDSKDKQKVEKALKKEGQTYDKCPKCQEPLELDKNGYCTNCGSKIK